MIDQSNNPWNEFVAKFIGNVYLSFVNKYNKPISYIGHECLRRLLMLEYGGKINRKGTIDALDYMFTHVNPNHPHYGILEVNHEICCDR